MKTIDLGNGMECRVLDNGDKCWYLNGKRHRTDGPAIEWDDGSKSWYINGKAYSEEDWEQVKEVLWAV